MDNPVDSVDCHNDFVRLSAIPSKPRPSPQGYRFSDIRIPNFERCTDLVSRLAVRFSDITRLMSWDLAINEDAEPVLIETNLTFSGVDVHQLANGPIYGNHPEPIIEEVVNNSYTLRKLLRL